MKWQNFRRLRHRLHHLKVFQKYRTNYRHRKISVSRGVTKVSNFTVLLTLIDKFSAIYGKLIQPKLMGYYSVLFKIGV